MTTVQQLIDQLMLIENKSIRVDIIVGDEDGFSDRETSVFELFSEHDDYVELFVHQDNLNHTP
jgi:hypothetical protein